MVTDIQMLPHEQALNFSDVLHLFVKTFQNIQNSSLKTIQVELSVLAPSGNDAVGEDMKNFADQLRPLVSYLNLHATNSNSVKVDDTCFLGCSGEV